MNDKNNDAGCIVPLLIVILILLLCMYQKMTKRPANPAPAVQKEQRSD